MGTKKKKTPRKSKAKPKRAKKTAKKTAKKKAKRGRPPKKKAATKRFSYRDTGAKARACLMVKLAEDSKLESKPTSMVFASLVGASLAQLDYLEARRKAGILASDEGRSIPSIVSGVKRLCETMGTVAQTDPDDDEEL